ncbi:MAG: hypothetical protein ACUVUU_03345 [bacterium]
MALEKCKHTWKMTNVRDGFIVTEKCYHCDKIRVFFSYEDAPPKDEYREGEHYWNYLGSAQSVKFEVECTGCGKKIAFGPFVGLMHCTGCDEKCHINILSRICEGQNVWIFAALAYDENGEVDLAVENLEVLTDYFSGRLRTPGKKILVVPGSLRRDPNLCRGEMLKDVGMLSLTSEGN